MQSGAKRTDTRPQPRTTGTHRAATGHASQRRRRAGPETKKALREQGFLDWRRERDSNPR